MNRTIVRLGRLGFAVLLVVTAAVRLSGQDEVGPVVVIDTEKGTFAFETFPEDAPATVAHVIALVRNHFYDGQRIHRATPGFVVQFGDPQTRDAGKRDLWGKGSGATSGTPIGLPEIAPKRTNEKGAVGMAHLEIPADADSQIYITLDDRHDLDGQYGVFGRLIEGDEVVAALQVGDLIRRVYIREP